MEKASKMQDTVSGGHTHVVFLDKNHPPNGGIKRALQDIDKFTEKANGVAVKKLYLVN